VAVEFVVTQNKAIWTSALVCSLGVYANVRAIVYVLTLIHVVTCMIVIAQHKSCFTSATIRSDEINADIRAFTVVLDTLVYVDAGKAVLIQLKAFMTSTFESAFSVYATLLASMQKKTRTKATNWIIFSFFIGRNGKNSKKKLFSVCSCMTSRRFENFLENPKSTENVEIIPKAYNVSSHDIIPKSCP
jgi:hypothetical protein